MEIIRIAGGDYFEYEALLLKRDSLEREAGLLLNEYTRVFGELLTEQYRAYIRCIELKKKIAFSQAEINRGGKVVEAELELFISVQMKEYYETLSEMAENNELCRRAEAVSEVDIRKIKKIYRNLAKQLHPDISPLTVEYPELLELWNRAVTAYKCNSLKGIEEVQVLVNTFLERNGVDHAEMVIPDIGEKIAQLKAEIERIISTDPYQYKFLLGDEVMVQEKKEEIRQSIDEMNA
ncbi:MAG: hypothetical protein KIG62_10500, partial [Oscillospiraceae bacterium]|nr:hypothetical protein [Oscillospiraceae bacterium]